MTQIGKYNEGVRELRTRIDFSKVRAEEGVKDLRSADEKVGEAFRLAGRIGQLLVEAAKLHADGAAKLGVGENEIVGISRLASIIFEGSETAQETIERIKSYREGYNLLATMAGFSSQGLREDNLPDTQKLYGDLRNRGGVMDNLVAGSMERIAEARRLDEDLRGRFA